MSSTLSCPQVEGLRAMYTKKVRDLEAKIKVRRLMIVSFVTFVTEVFLLIRWMLLAVISSLLTPHSSLLRATPP